MKILFMLNRDEVNQQTQRRKHDKEFYIKYVINK